MTSTMLTLLICAIFTLGVVAAPPVFAPADALTADGAPIRRIPTPVKVSKTQPRDARCTDGVPASEQHHSDYPIRGYTKIEPQASMVSYEVRKDWYDAHWVSGPHYMASTHSSDPYSAFECQFTCNANDSCTAYFVWYEDVNTQNEHTGCVLFDSIINSSVFVATNNTIGAGGYDKLCPH